jgi:hypothetical protein
MNRDEMVDRLKGLGFTPDDAAHLADVESERQRQAGPGARPGELTIPKEIAADPAAAHEWWLERLIEQPNRPVGHHPATAQYLESIRQAKRPQRPARPEGEEHGKDQAAGQ